MKLKNVGIVLLGSVAWCVTILVVFLILLLTDIGWSVARFCSHVKGRVREAAAR